MGQTSSSNKGLPAIKSRTTACLAAASLAAAFAVTLVAAPSDGHRPGPPRGPDAVHHGSDGHPDRGHRNMKRGDASGDRLDRLIARMDLSDDQIKAIRAERDDRADDARALRDEIVDAQRKLRVLGQEMREAIASHLTDEQKAKLAAGPKGKGERGERRGRRGDRERGERPDRSQHKPGADDAHPAKHP